MIDELLNREIPDPEAPHPAAAAWDDLVAANQSLKAASEARSGSIYRTTALVTARRARRYLQAMEALLEELGE